MSDGNTCSRLTGNYTPRAESCKTAQCAVYDECPPENPRPATAKRKKEPTRVLAPVLTRHSRGFPRFAGYFPNTPVDSRIACTIYPAFDRILDLRSPFL